MKIKMKTKKSQKTKSTKAAPRKRATPLPTAASLDAYAQAYAKLLANPCAAPLAHPVYAGSDAGILVRTEASVAVFAGAGITGGYLNWTPGAVCTNGANFVYGEDGAASAVYSAAVPGLTYLKAQASAARCVAACLQITFLGAELNRSGIVAMGRTPGDLLASGTAYSASALESTLEHYTRTPDKTIELTWMPGMADQAFVDPNDTLNSEELASRSGLGMVAYGLPAAVGVRIRTVAIYEYKPKASLGITYSSSARAKSSNSLDHVLNKVQETTNKIMEVGSTAYKIFEAGTKLAAMMI